MPIPLRADFNAGLVRAAAKRSKDGPQAQLLEIEACDGKATSNRNSYVATTTAKNGRAGG